MLYGPAVEGRLSAILAAVLLLFLPGCAAQRGPVLYPNEHLKAVGEGEAKRDIEECNRLAEKYVKSQRGSEAAKGAAGGAVGGAIVGGAVGAVTGHLGRGAAIGLRQAGRAGSSTGQPRRLNPTRCTEILSTVACAKRVMNQSAGNNHAAIIMVVGLQEESFAISFFPSLWSGKFIFQGLAPFSA